MKDRNMAKDRMKSLRLAAVAVMLGVSITGVAVEYEDVMVDDVTYSLQCDYCDPMTMVEASRNNQIVNPEYLVDYLIWNGDYYFGIFSGNNNDVLGNLTVFSREGAGWKVSEVSIDWNGFAPPEQSFLRNSYPGNDSGGHPYICYPCCTNNDGTVVGMTVYPLEISDGSVRATGRYGFSVESGWYSRPPSVHGDITSGNFTVTALMWTHPNADPKSGSQTPLVRWEYRNGSEVSRSEFVDYYSYTPSVQDLGGNYVLVDERGEGDARNSYDYIAPTVCDVSGRYITEYSRFDDNTPYMDSGSRIFSIGGQWLLISPGEVGYRQLGYTLSRLPQYPYSLSGAEKIWDLVDPFTTASEVASGYPLYDNSKITVIPSDGNHSDIYIYSRTTGLSHYRLSRSEGTSTGTVLQPESAVPAEHYTLSGIRISADSPGLYIEKRATGSRVVLKK